MTVNKMDELKNRVYMAKVNIPLSSRKINAEFIKEYPKYKTKIGKAQVKNMISMRHVSPEMLEELEAFAKSF